MPSALELISVGHAPLCERALHLLVIESSEQSMFQQQQQKNSGHRQNPRTFAGGLCSRVSSCSALEALTFIDKYPRLPHQFTGLLHHAAETDDDTD